MSIFVYDAIPAYMTINWAAAFEGARLDIEIPEHRIKDFVKSAASNGVELSYHNTNGKVSTFYVLKIRSKDENEVEGKIKNVLRSKNGMRTSELCLAVQEGQYIVKKAMEEMARKNIVFGRRAQSGNGRGGRPTTMWFLQETEL